MNKALEDVRRIWKLCFSDSPEFVDFYFQRRYRETQNQARYDEEGIVCALQRIPYEMTFAGIPLPIAYVSGACTHPEKRRRGWMRTLLQDTHRQMFRDDRLLSTLIPATTELWKYYENCGYVPLFFQQKQLLLNENFVVDDSDDRIPAYHCQESCDVSPRMLQFLKQESLKRPYAIQHDPEDWDAVITDLWMSDGVLLLVHADPVSDDEEIQGVAFVYRNSGNVEIRDYFAKNATVKHLLFQKAFQIAGPRPLYLVSPAFSQDDPKGMGRVINVPAFLETYARIHPNVKLAIQIPNDADIPENEGYYIVEQGEIRTGYLPGYAYTPYSIPELTAFLFSGCFPFMSLMLE